MKITTPGYYRVCDLQGNQLFREDGKPIRSRDIVNATEEAINLGFDVLIKHPTKTRIEFGNKKVNTSKANLNSTL